MSPLSVAVVGHVTNDVLEEGLRPGGAALYAALTAQALGAEVTLLTRAGPDFVGRSLLARLGRVELLPASRTTAFDERYRHGRRTVRLLAHAGPLEVTPPPADLVIVCPVADEVPLALLSSARPRRLLAAGLQGWLRAFARDGTASPRRPADLGAFAACGLVSLSEEDVAGLGPELLADLRVAVRRVALTAGASGARLDGPDGVLHLPPFQVASVDPTGAGDVFLAALAVRLAAGDVLVDAGAWAACAGALATTAVGTDGIPGLDALASAVERYRR
jgi:sugar/nucleoside kinase (ribokinase family)